MGKHQNSHGGEAAPGALEPGALCNQNKRDQMSRGPLCSQEFVVSTGTQRGYRDVFGTPQTNRLHKSTDPAVREPSQEPAGPQAQEELREKPSMPRPNTEENSQCQFPWPGKLVLPAGSWGTHSVPSPCSAWSPPQDEQKSSSYLGRNPSG